MTRRIFIGSWSLPSGNNAEVYLFADSGRLDCCWDIAPDLALPAGGWPRADVDDYATRVFPAIMQAVAARLKIRTLGLGIAGLSLGDPDSTGG